MLVRLGVDQIKVSIDGPKEVNDLQRGQGSYEKALEGIKSLHEEKIKAGKTLPQICIIYTITRDNYNTLEDFFLNNPHLELSWLYHIIIQMQNFITQEMGDQYASFLKSEFGEMSDIYWKGFVRTLGDFEDINAIELEHQANTVFKEMDKFNIKRILLPPTLSSENLSAYLQTKWSEMTDLYEMCQMPWICADITASGDVAPCHTLYDLKMGNLHDKSFNEIWFSEQYQNLRDYLIQHTFLPVCNIGCCGLYYGGKKKRKNRKASHYNLYT